jgi:hypothetical protein
VAVGVIVGDGLGVAAGVGVGIGVAVAVGVGVAVGGIGVAVGGTSVGVGGASVGVGASGAAVGGRGVAVGGSGVAVGGTGVEVAVGSAVGIAVARRRAWARSVVAKGAISGATSSRGGRDPWPPAVVLKNRPRTSKLTTKSPRAALARPLSSGPLRAYGTTSAPEGPG